MATIDLKITHTTSGETRLLSIPNKPVPTWDRLVQQIQQRFSLKHAPTALTYVDEDGDAITLSTDEELAEVWATNAAEITLAFAFGGAALSDPADVPRDAEQIALLASVRSALEQDATLAHDLRKVVHDVLGHGGRHRHARHLYGHPYHQAQTGYGPCGRGGRKMHGRGGRRHEGREAEARSRSRPGEDDGASSSGENTSATEEQGDEDGKYELWGHKGHKGGRRHGKHGRFPHDFAAHGPPPEALWHFGHRGFGAAPPPPPPFDGTFARPPPPFGFDASLGHGRGDGTFARPPPPFGFDASLGHGRGDKRGKHFGKGHGPRPPFPPPPFEQPEGGPSSGGDPFSFRDWYEFTGYPGPPARRHGRHHLN